MSLAGLRKNDQLGLTQISLDWTVSQYSHTLRWARGKEQLVQMPSRACPEVPREPLSPLLNPPRLSRHKAGSGTSLQIIQPSRRSLQTSDISQTASYGSAFSFFSPDKVPLCPGWHLYFDGKNQPPWLRPEAIITEYVAVFYLSQVFFCVFYICLVVSTKF